MTEPSDTTENVRLSDLVRKVHRGYPSGVMIVTTMDDDQPQGLAVSAFSSVSLDPPTIMVLVSFTSSNHARLYTKNVLGVNIVSTEQAAVVRQFSKSGADKFAGVEWHLGKYGTPLLTGASGFFEIEVQDRILAHTHTIFIGQVLDAGVREDAAPMVYVNGRFHDGGKLIDLEDNA